jgi:hypothetical protein
MTWMKWLAALALLLVLATMPVPAAWAKKDDSDKTPDKPAPEPAPEPPAQTVINHQVELSFAWYVMDRTDPTIRLAGPYVAEESCRAVLAGYHNGTCRVVRN